MGIGDIFKAKKNQELELENLELKRKISKLEEYITPEIKNAVNISEEISRSESKLDKLNALISEKENRVKEIEIHIEELNKQIIQTDNVILMQSFGVYEPTYDFATSDEYKQEIEKIRNYGKKLIEDGGAVAGSTTWSVNGDLKKGKKIVADMQKLLLRAFNIECDELIKNVKYNNYTSCKKRIESSCKSVSKLGPMMNIYITLTFKPPFLSEPIKKRSCWAGASFFYRLGGLIILYHKPHTAKKCGAS